MSEVGKIRVGKSPGWKVSEVGKCLKLENVLVGKSLGWKMSEVGKSLSWKKSWWESV